MKFNQREIDTLLYALDILLAAVDMGDDIIGQNGEEDSGLLTKAEIEVLKMKLGVPLH